MVSVPRSGISSSIVCSQIDLGLWPRIQHSLIFGQLNKHLFSKNKTIQSNSFKSGHCVIIKLIKVTLITVENMINIKKKSMPIKGWKPQHWPTLTNLKSAQFYCVTVSVPQSQPFPLSQNKSQVDIWRKLHWVYKKFPTYATVYISLPTLTVFVNCSPDKKGFCYFSAVVSG